MGRLYEKADLEPIFQVLEEIIQADLRSAANEKRWDWARALETALAPIPVVGTIVGIEKSVRGVIEYLQGDDHLDNQIVFNMLSKDLLYEFSRRQLAVIEAVGKQNAQHVKQEALLRTIIRILEKRAEEMTPEQEQEVLKRYLEMIIPPNAQIDIQGFGSKPGAGHEALTFPIEELYTPLKTVDPTNNERMLHENQIALAFERADEEKLPPLTKMLRDGKRLLIVGQAGGGKTTFLRLITHVLATDALHEGEAGYEPNRQKHLGMSLNKQAPIPILLRIPTLGHFIEENGLNDLECGGELCWVRDDLARSYGKEIADVLEKHLENKKCALLLDGLDEIADEQLRKKMVDTIRSLLQQWGGNIIVISSRPYGYQAIGGLDDLQMARIAKFGKKEIKLFVDRWDKGLPEKKQTETGLPYKDALERAILDDPNIRELAGNPVMLTCLCVVHWNEQHLPQGKANLLAAVLRWLLSAREAKRSERGDNGEFVNEAFKRLAYEMSNNKKGKQVDVELDWAANELVRTYQEEIGETNTNKARRKAKKLLAAETIDSGIIEQAEIGLRFWHQTFQDHYAAKALLDMNEDQWWLVVQAHLEEKQWSEIIDQVAGSLAAEKSRSKLRWLLNRIIQTATEDNLHKTAVAIGVADRLLQLLTVYKFHFPVNEEWKQALNWAQAIFGEEGAAVVPIEYRIPAAEAIGRVGDPRFRPMEPKMLPILGMENVLLGKYPVTVLEYKSFIDAGGYRESSYWADDWEVVADREWSQPRIWDNQLLHPTRPVIGVSWIEANAYCKWLSKRTGKAYRLPTNAEWKSAAKNPKGGEYPWGEEEPNEELLNFNRNVGSPTPVGLYPAGSGEGGHLDLAGNVWEWCWDWYDEGKKFRVVRGGGWFTLADLVRASYRGWDDPDVRGNSFGFRLSRDCK
ncbi:MAG TPA: SUMF1/EgtB/PvdO family nonheme iron enzyme [bacterium]|nr:SUMF1/EgtB/PvdO family nonheme iron enzyme [bacterium]